MQISATTHLGDVKAAAVQPGKRRDRRTVHARVICALLPVVFAAACSLGHHGSGGSGDVYGASDSYRAARDQEDLLHAGMHRRDSLLVYESREGMSAGADDFGPVRRAGHRDASDLYGLLSVKSDRVGDGEARDHRDDPYDRGARRTGSDDAAEYDIAMRVRQGLSLYRTADLAGEYAPVRAGYRAGDERDLSEMYEQRAGSRVAGQEESPAVVLADEADLYDVSPLVRLRSPSGRAEKPDTELGQRRSGSAPSAEPGRETVIIASRERTLPSESGENNRALRVPAPAVSVRQEPLPRASGAPASADRSRSEGAGIPPSVSVGTAAAPPASDLRGAERSKGPLPPEAEKTATTDSAGTSGRFPGVGIKTSAGQAGQERDEPSVGATESASVVMAAQYGLVLFPESVYPPNGGASSPAAWFPLQFLMPVPAPVEVPLPGSGYLPSVSPASSEPSASTCQEQMHADRVTVVTASRSDGGQSSSRTQATVKQPDRKSVPGIAEAPDGAIMRQGERDDRGDLTGGRETGRQTEGEHGKSSRRAGEQNFSTSAATQPPTAPSQKVVLREVNLYRTPPAPEVGNTADEDSVVDRGERRWWGKDLYAR